MATETWGQMHAEIRRIVLLDESAAQAEQAALDRAEREAYSRYTGSPSVPVAEAGTPQAAGHGSWVCGLNRGGVQDKWLAARRAAGRYRAIRSGAWQPERQTETVRYGITVDFGRHEIEVDHCGVDLSGCRNPAEAIALVRRSILAA